MGALFSPHPLVLQTAYSELKRQASEQELLLVGTPGTVSVKTVNGRAFLYRQFYDANGAKRAHYLGAQGDDEAEQRAERIREAILVTNGLLTQARLLARQGYVRADSAPSAVNLALASHGLFRAGASLIGSHAYGVLLNELGVRAAPFRTEDVDIARDRRLTLAEPTKTFAEMLVDSTIDLTPALGFDRKKPPTSYKAPGKEGLRVDLLVPTRGAEISSKPVPELGAHATALPHLSYLLEDPMDAVLLGREAVIPIKVPRPERFALHKALLSQLRHATSDKATKDVHQAATLIAALSEREPGALEEAFAEAPVKTKTRAGLARVLALLDTTQHTRAAELLRAL